MSDLLVSRLNDTIYSATSCRWDLFGAPYVGIVAFGFSEKLERKLVHAARRDGTPLGVAGGKYSIDSLTMSMLLTSAQIFQRQLAAAGLGRSYGKTRFPIVATYAEPLAQLEGVEPVVIAIDKARITGRKQTHAEGIDEAIVEYELMAITATVSGMQLWSDVNG